MNQATASPPFRTTDEILSDAAKGKSPQDAESKRDLERFSRTRHVELVRSLSTVNGYRTTAYLTLQWGVIIGTLATAAWADHWLVYFVSVFVVSSRMQAIGVLLHDGTHWLLYKNRTVNDVVCDLFVAFPLGLSTTLYRKTHFRHHRYTNTTEDQDLAAQREEREWFEWPKTRLGLAWVLIRSVLGINALKAWVLFKHWAPWNNFRSPDFPPRCRVLYVFSTLVIYGIFATAFMANARVTLILMALYSVAGFTLLNLINRVRATAEHIGTRGTHELNDTRTVVPSLLDRFFIAPYGVSFHLEHHLFPSVPGCQLPKLHRELMKDDEYRKEAHITKHYAGVIRELMNDGNPMQVKAEPAA